MDGGSPHHKWLVAGIIGVISLALAACADSPHQTSSSGSVSGAAKCQYLTGGDFKAIGETLHGQPIANHESAVHVSDCYYDLGTQNDLVYLDFFDSPYFGQQNYTNATLPGIGEGNPVPVSGVGNSAFWLPKGNTLFVKKGSTVFQLKLNESGKSNAQIQADATQLASRIAGRIP
jgi:hypothetical protein